MDDGRDRHIQHLLARSGMRRAGVPRSRSISKFQPRKLLRKTMLKNDQSWYIINLTNNPKICP